MVLTGIKICAQPNVVIAALTIMPIICPIFQRCNEEGTGPELLGWSPGSANFLMQTAGETKYHSSSYWNLVIF